MVRRTQLFFQTKNDRGPWQTAVTVTLRSRYRFDGEA